MIRKTYTIKNKLGLHLRAASMLAELVSRYKSDARIIFKDTEGDARSVLTIIETAANQGDTVEFTASGEDEHALITALDDLITNRSFDED